MRARAGYARAAAGIVSSSYAEYEEKERERGQTYVYMCVRSARGYGFDYRCGWDFKVGSWSLSCGVLLLLMLQLRAFMRKRRRTEVGLVAVYTGLFSWERMWGCMCGVRSGR